MFREDKPLVTFIIPFIGNKFPSYINLFLNSCKFNSRYLFIIFTNLQLDGNIPGNVRVIKTSKAEIEELIFKKTGIKANLSRFYKICDFKPAFGEIFSDYIKDSGYWGHSDMDLILGNLNKILTPLLTEYDVLSFRSEYHTGSFAVYRNIPRVNSLYRKVRNYDTTLSDPVHRAFDEVSRFKSGYGNIYNYLIQGNNILEADTEVESFTHLLKSENYNSDIKIFSGTLLKEGISTGMILKFERGRIIIQRPGTSKYKNGEEFLLYHFVLEKALLTFKYPKWNQIPAEYYITRFGFHKYKFLIPFEIVLRKIKLLFIQYPMKIVLKLKRFYSERIIVNEPTI